MDALKWLFRLLTRIWEWMTDPGRIKHKREEDIDETENEMAEAIRDGDAARSSEHLSDILERLPDDEDADNSAGE